jgi:hypothetical protein
MMSACPRPIPPNSSDLKAGCTGIGVKTGQTNYGNNVGMSITFNGLAFDGPTWRMNDAAKGGPTTLASILDGTSNTAAHSEWLKGRNVGTGRQAVWTGLKAYSRNPGSYWPAANGAYQTVQQVLEQVASNCHPNVNTQATWDQKGMLWACNLAGVGGGYSHLLARTSRPASTRSTALLSTTSPRPVTTTSQ